MSEKAEPKLSFVADDVKRFLSMFPSLVAFSQQLEHVGNLQRSADESEARIVKADHDYKARKLELDHRIAHHEDQVALANQAAAEAAAKVKKMLDDARAEAEHIVKAAHDAVMVDDAGHQQRIAVATANLNEVNGRIAGAKEELEQIRQQKMQVVADVQEMARRHKELRESLDALKARL